MQKGAEFTMEGTEYFLLFCSQHRPQGRFFPSVLQTVRKFCWTIQFFPHLYLTVNALSWQKAPSSFVHSLHAAHRTHNGFKLQSPLESQNYSGTKLYNVTLEFHFLKAISASFNFYCPLKRDSCLHYSVICCLSINFCFLTRKYFTSFVCEKPIC